MAILNQDLSQIKAQDGFDPLPPGEYQVQISDTEVVKSKASENMMLKVTFTVFEGDFDDRKVWDHYVLGNAVAMSRLKALAIAAKHPHPDYLQDSEELHGLTLKIKVKLSQDDPKYAPQNKITSFKPLETAPLPTLPATPPPPTMAPPAPSKPSTMPSLSFSAGTASAPPPPPAKFPWES